MQFTQMTYVFWSISFIKGLRVAGKRWRETFFGKMTPVRIYLDLKIPTPSQRFFLCPELYRHNCRVCLVLQLCCKKCLFIFCESCAIPWWKAGQKNQLLLSKVRQKYDVIISIWLCNSYVTMYVDMRQNVSGWHGFSKTVNYKM